MFCVPLSMSGAPRCHNVHRQRPRSQCSLYRGRFDPQGTSLEQREQAEKLRALRFNGTPAYVRVLNLIHLVSICRNLDEQIR